MESESALGASEVPYNSLAVAVGLRPCFRVLSS